MAVLYKLILSSSVILFIVLLTSQLTFSAETCELAVPRYGVVQCSSTGVSETISGISFTKANKEISLTLSCLSDCKIERASDIKDPEGRGLFSGGDKFCSGADELYVYMSKNGNVVKREGATSSTDAFKNSFPIEFNREDTFSIRMLCKFFGGQTNNTRDGSSISYTQTKIKLYEGWAGSLPTTPIPNTEGCSLNAVVDKYRGDTSVTSYLNPSTGNTETKPYSTYNDVYQVPKNWKVTDNYIFVKDWQTGIAGISLTYDKSKNAYWCGGLTGSRKIYSVNKVTSATGACYSIPTSTYLSGIECCFPSDCSAKGPTYTCNPESWKCEETKPCNSNLECEQTFGAGICQNKQITSWSCDTTKKWGDYAGTCVKGTRQVFQCSSDCTSTEYYNEEDGKCKSRPTVTTTTTTTTTTTIAKTQNVQQNELITGKAIASSGSFDTSTLFVFLVILGILIGVGYYFLATDKGKSILSGLEGKSKPEKRSASSDKFCGKCGKSVKSGIKFCGSCGNKV